MLLEDVVSLGEDRVPLMVRMLRRALTTHSNILIDLNVKSGRKRGFLTDVEEGGGWSTGDVGTKIPTYRFAYHRPSNSGIGTFELPAAIIDSTMTFTKEDGELKVVNVVDKMNEMQVEGEPPLWFNLLKKGLAAGKNFYFASGGNKIYNAHYTPTSIRLAMKNRKTKAENAYTMVPDNFEKWKLEKFEDGHRLIMTPSVKVTEAAEEPTVVSMFKKLLDDGQQVFFRDRAGKKTQLRHTMTGVSTSGKPAWWFYDSSNPAYRKAITWKVGETIDKLTLKKDGDHWVLFDKTVKLKEGQGEEPLVIALINKRIAQQGAVSVDIVENNKRVRGWITEPIVPSPFSTPDDFYYKTMLHKMIGNKRVFILRPDADDLFRVTQQKEKNGKTSLKLVSRGVRNEAE